MSFELRYSERRFFLSGGAKEQPADHAPTPDNVDHSSDPRTKSLAPGHPEPVAATPDPHFGVDFGQHEQINTGAWLRTRSSSLDKQLVNDKKAQAEAERADMRRKGIDEQTIASSLAKDYGVIPWEQATKVSPEDEAKFQADFAAYAKKLGINSDPDAVEHFYDYRAAWKAGRMTADASQLSSDFKLAGHSRMYMPSASGGFINSRTGEPATRAQIGANDDIRIAKLKALGSGKEPSIYKTEQHLAEQTKWVEAAKAEAQAQERERDILDRLKAKALDDTPPPSVSYETIYGSFALSAWLLILGITVSLALIATVTSRMLGWWNG